MRGQALDHAVRRDLSRGLRLLPGQDFLANRVARQVEFPLEQLPCQQPMITALGLPDFWQFSVEALFAKAIGSTDWKGYATEANIYAERTALTEVQDSPLAGVIRGDYALIADCHSAALVSKDASIDWCCMPRYDSGSIFGRILDWERGGYCALRPQGRGVDVSRRYVDRTMVLETTFRTGGGEARLFDCFTMRRGGRHEPHKEILRIVEGVRGRVDLVMEMRSSEASKYTERETPIFTCLLSMPEQMIDGLGI